MKLEWDRHIGPSSIIGIVGSLSVIATLGVVWGTTMSKIETAAALAAEAKIAAKEVSDLSVRRDERISSQAERLGKIETSMTFIGSALSRIESKLDVVAAK